MKKSKRKFNRPKHASKAMRKSKAQFKTEQAAQVSIIKNFSAFDTFLRKYEK
jgi:hypothetical protein